jgi:RNA polymerase sigma-70 factor (ECF subfamily)
VPPVEPAGPALGSAVEHLVLTLPPKERACVLLKDVLDCSLEEIAELVGSTVGGVKAALSRGRSKLGGRPDRTRARVKSDDETRLLQLYVERFNQRDWAGLRDLISADARLLVADRFLGRLVDSPYFTNYARISANWRITLGEVDGEAVVVALHRPADEWTPRALIRLELHDGRISGIRDYWHCPWVVPATRSLDLVDAC